LKVGGLPAAAVQRELVKRLADGYIERPVVSVAVQEFASRRFFVLGEVRQPGAYPLAGSTTVLEALLTAGGPTATAGTQVHIVRAGATASDAVQSPAATMDLAALQRGDLAHNVALRDGDLLYLPPVEAPIPVYVMGLVNAPGAYQLRRGMTVLQALAQAGGVSDRGSTSRVKIVRKVDGRTVELKAALDDVVEPGDTLVVRRRYF
jgi:polysaccharide export outer membrane protein